MVERIIQKRGMVSLAELCHQLKSDRSLIQQELVDLVDRECITCLMPVVSRSATPDAVYYRWRTSNDGAFSWQNELLVRDSNKKLHPNECLTRI